MLLKERKHYILQFANKWSWLCVWWYIWFGC